MAGPILIKTLEDCYNELAKKGVTLQTKYNFIHKKKTKNTTLGRIWFNLLLPDNYPEFVDVPVNKKALEAITYKIYDMNSAEDAAAILTKMQQEAFKLATINPITFSKDSFLVPKDIREKRKKLITDELPIEDYPKVTKELANELLKESKDQGLKDLIDSKTSGKLNDAALGTWVIAKGPIMDVENQISKPIKSPLIDGYNGEEYYTAASEARRGFFIRAVGTTDPGTLARHIVFAMSNTKLTDKDCKTKHYLTLFVREPMFNNLIGRWYLNPRTNKLEQITKDSKNIINTTIKLRSPIYCQDRKGICPICFGRTKEELGTDKIGIIDGAIINAVGVQGYTMKARHAATTINIKKCDFTKDIIPT